MAPTELKWVLLKHGIKQIDVVRAARKYGFRIHPASVSELACGRGRPSAKTLVAVQVALKRLGVPLPEILGIEDLKAWHLLGPDGWGQDI